MLFKSYLFLFLWNLNQLKPQLLNHTVLSPTIVLIDFCCRFLSPWGQTTSPQCVTNRGIYVLSYTCLTLLPLVYSNSNKLLYLHDRITLQYCKSMYMTIKIKTKQH